ncbi:MAG: chemotaxis protein CheR [Gemmatimonadales bacterium]|nr:MAG: chemotaxis protein CheR [Gemmatimonadales bacterium]
MSDESCVAFLQWALPRMEMRWKGFRKVRRQVCRRIRQRMAELEVPGFEEYRTYLEGHPEEWRRLAPLCRVTISRFARDRGIWRLLGEEVLPGLAGSLPSGAPLRAWSAGCASGEEPFTLSILWRMELEPHFPGHPLEVVATDVDPAVLQRARAGRYSASSLKEVASHRVDAAFTRVEVEQGETIHRLRDEYRRGVTFLRQDLRNEMPEGPFQLIFCRNVAFTYFDTTLQRRILEGLLERLVPGGALVLGSHEKLPVRNPSWPLAPWVRGEPVYRLERLES